MKLSVKLILVLAIVLVVAEVSESRHRHRHRRRWRYRRCNRVRVTAAPARTTQPPATTAPVTIPPDVLALFDSLAALPLLLFFNMFANTLPPPGNGDIPVPLARSGINTRSLDEEQPTDALCRDWELSSESTSLLNDVRSGRISAGGNQGTQLRDYLRGLHICELTKFSRQLDDTGSGPALDMLNVFMLAPDTPPAIRKEVHTQFVSAVADVQYDSIHRSKRQSYRYNLNLSSAYLLLNRYSNALQNPQMRQMLAQLYLRQFPTTTTTPTPPSSSDVTRRVLKSVMSTVFPSMGVGLKYTFYPNSDAFDAYVSSVVDVVTASHKFIRQLERTLRRLIQATKFRRRQAACNRLYQFATSIRRPYGERLLASYAYKWFNCTRPDKDNNTPKPVPRTKTTTTTTTPAPTSACGVSQELDSLSRAESEPFFATTRLTGGTNTGSCSLVPWQVRLNVTEGGHDRFCAGSILDATHILTAAHCVKQDSTVEVIVGDYNVLDTESSEQIRIVKASDVVKHPGYETNVYGFEMNDVAVVKLSEPLDMTQPCTEPVCLQPDFALTNGQNCTVSGWSSLGGVTEKLQFANLATYQGNQCISAFNITFSAYLSDPNQQLCAGFIQDGVDPCQGDAGGPLVCRDNTADAYVQVGIVSYGNGCGMENFPGVYTQVNSYYDWIKTQLNN